MITKGVKASELTENDEILVYNGSGWWKCSIIGIYYGGQATVNILIAGEHARKLWFYPNEVVNKVVG